MKSNRSGAGLLFLCAWVLLFVVTTVAQAAPASPSAAATASGSRPANVASARPPAASTAVTNYPKYIYQAPVQQQRSPATPPQTVQSTGSSSNRYKFTEVAPRSLW